MRGLASFAGAKRRFETKYLSSSIRITIINAMHRHGPVETRYLPDLGIAHHTIGNALKPGDLFLTLGAGNVHECGMRIARDLALLEDLERTAGGSLEGKLYEPMSRHTTMGVGGCAQYWLEPSTFSGMQAAVNYCRDRNIPVHVIGRGSNIIVRDGGLRGAVIHPSGENSMCWKSRGTASPPERACG